jgi:hypothetical protein
VAEERETAREVAVRRIPFCETNVDDVLDETGYLADGDDYERKLDTIDDSQHLDVEIVESYPSKVYNGPSPQDVKVSLDNSALKEAYAKPPNDAKRPPLRLDPFQNIRNVCWGSGATEFGIGEDGHLAVIEQDATTVSNPSTMTISMWVRVNYEGAPDDAGIVVPIIEMGADVENGNDGLAITLYTNTTFNGGNNALAVGLTGEKDSIVMDDYVSGDTDHVPWLGGGLLWTPHLSLFSNAGGGSATESSLAVNKWVHIFLAINLADVSAVDAGNQFVSGNTMMLFVNGVFADGLSGGNPTTGSPPGSQGDFPPGVGWPFVLSNDFRFEEWPHTRSGTDSGVPWKYIVSIPAWKPSINGFRTALPLIREYADYSGQSFAVDYAAVQIWTDQFIDPTTHIDKFVKLDPGNPTKPLLVDPSVAQKAFGKPTFFFDGPPSRFVNNRGSGGEFTKIGDLKSFRPAPPKASAS